MKQQIIIIGGDNRSPYIAQLLQKENYEVFIYGLERYTQLPMDVHITTQLIPGDMYLLPIPITKDGKTVNAPYSSKPLLLKEIFNACNTKSLLLAGNITEKIEEKLKILGIDYFDYGKQESFAQANALPTAEGTIELMMKHTPYVIENKSVCVVGYGRIGKILAKKLSALGCRVTVTARNELQLLDIANEGYTPLHTYQLQNAPKFNIIINTVPALVINSAVLQKQSKNCLIIDLASMPGGTDFHAAKAKGIQAIHALSLPAKHAPLTAAKIITDTILQFLHERE